jgi:hypothetical protein
MKILSHKNVQYLYDYGIKKKKQFFLPWELTIEGLPSIFKVIRIRSTVHLAVEFGVYDWTIRLVNWVCIITNPSASKQCTRALVSLDHGSSVLVIVVVVSQAQ